jgi:DNA repair photolyase
VPIKMNISRGTNTVQYECIKAKSLLSKKEMLAEGWFHINRSLNAYRGCEHGCIYCDGMSEYYHVDNFTTHIRIKENAPDILRKELKKLGYSSQQELENETLWSFLPKEDAARLAMNTPRKIVIGVCGGVSDGYQPAEKEHKITQKILETLLDFRLPAMILTKSDLVLRDMDLLKELNEVALVNTMFTITLHDDETRKIIEPRASSTQERFAALKELRKASIPGGVMATPIIPWIGSTYENMEGLAREAKAAGAEFILFGGMTLKPGRQKEYFFSIIKKRFPEFIDKIRPIYEDDNRYGTPIWKRIPINTMLLGHEICKKVGIRDRSIRHRLPFEHEANNKVLGVLLDIEFYQQFMLGRPWSMNRPFHDLSVKIERSVDDLKCLMDEGRLKEQLSTNDNMTEIVNQIIDTGTCDYLKQLIEHTHLDGVGNQALVISDDESDN